MNKEYLKQELNGTYAVILLLVLVIVAMIIVIIEQNDKLVYKTYKIECMHETQAFNEQLILDINKGL